MLLGRFADEMSVDSAGWYLSHSKVVSRDRESLGHKSPLPLTCEVLVVTTVQLLHAAHHSEDVVDDGKAVLGPGQGHVGQSDPLLQSPC